MPTASMASPPTSRLAFVATDGSPLPGPREWAPGFVEVRVPVEQWQRVRLSRQGQPMTVTARDLGGRARVVADWPLSGTGHYGMRLEVPSGIGQPETVTWTIRPEKITDAAYG